MVKKTDAHKKDETEQDFDPEKETIVRAKWTIDGAKTLEEAAQKSEAFATELRRLAKDGWELTAPVSDDYGFCEKG